MRYKQIPDPDAVMQFDDAGNTEIIRPANEEAWAAYTEWLSEGNVAEPFRPLPALSQARERAAERLSLTVDATLQPVLSRYSKGEAESWPVQLFEASQWLADPGVSTPLVDSLRGDTDKSEMCHAIIAKGAVFAQLCGHAIAWRRACSAWIEQCTSIDDLMAWEPNYPEVPHAAH
jgi:hypothetical protein